MCKATACVLTFLSCQKGGVALVEVEGEAQQQRDGGVMVGVAARLERTGGAQILGRRMLALAEAEPDGQLIEDL